MTDNPEEIAAELKDLGKPTGEAVLAPATGSAAIIEPGPNQYRCAWCGNIYDLQRNEDWNEEKAHAERERDFPGVPKEQCAVVCDDCYQKCRPDTHPKEYEAYKAERN